jgi:methyl-accepting chemotaxis protein
LMDAVTQQNAALVEQASAARPDHAPVKAGPL